METISTRSYRDLIVWQKAMDLTVAVYELTAQLPTTERYNLVSQMRRSAVSIPSNIAEGRYRSTIKDYKNFLRIAFASGAELETQIELVKRLPMMGKPDCGRVDAPLEEVMKMLNTMVR